AFDGDKPHVRSPHRFGDGFGIDVVVLVGLYVRLHIPGRHQPNFMTLLAQSATQEVRACAGFHAHQPHAQISSEPKQLRAREFSAHHHFASRAQTNKVKDRLPQIDADRVDFHGPPPVLTSYVPRRGRGGGPYQLGSACRHAAVQCDGRLNRALIQKPKLRSVSPRCYGSLRSSFLTDGLPFSLSSIWAQGVWWSWVKRTSHCSGM